MGGWDVIYASSVEKLNEVLAASTAKLLPTFSFTDQSLQIDFSGDFGPWAIQPGGSANRINLKVPITSGSLQGPFPSTIDLSGVEPEINVALALLSGSTSGTDDVEFDITTNATQPTNDDGAVYVANPDLTGTLAQRDPSGQAAQILRDWLGEVFVQNKEKISFVFATVFTDPQTEPWLKPKATQLSYFQNTAGSLEAVAIQALTQSPWGVDSTTGAVDPSLLTPGDDLFYALSQGAFMANLLLPATATALGVSSGDLRFNGPSTPAQQNSASITNATSIHLPAVENAGTHYYPVVDKYEVTISGNQIKTVASGQFAITGLAHAYVTFDNLEVVNEITYDSTTKELGFVLVSKTEPSTTRHIPWYEIALSWIVPVIGIIVTAVIEIVVSTIESSVQDALKGTGNLSVSAIQLETGVWAGLSQFDVSEAELSEALVIKATGAS